MELDKTVVARETEKLSGAGSDGEVKILDRMQLRTGNPKTRKQDKHRKSGVRSSYFMYEPWMQSLGW